MRHLSFLYSRPLNQRRALLRSLQIRLPLHQLPHSAELKEILVEASILVVLHVAVVSFISIFIYFAKIQ